VLKHSKLTLTLTLIVDRVTVKGLIKVKAEKRR